jgi:hypothetical protein
MPMQSGSGWTGIPWHCCDCHQKQYPVSMLKRQDGLLVCPEGFDNPQRTRSIDQRQVTIQQRLSDPSEEPELADILKTTDDSNDDM